MVLQSNVVVDTNVLSELCREAPDRAVLRWYSMQSGRHLYTTAITRGEMLYVVMNIADGRKKVTLEAQVTELLDVMFEGRQLPFDDDAADIFAVIKANARRLGRPCSDADAMIAAIARLHGYVVATRDVSDFETLGVGIVNPFDASEDLCKNDAYRIAAGDGSYSVRDRSRSPTYQYRTN